MQAKWGRNCGSLVMFKEGGDLMTFYCQATISNYSILVNKDGSSRLMTQNEWDKNLFKWIPNFQELHEMTNMRWDEFMSHCIKVIEDRVEFPESSYNIDEEIAKWSMLEAGIMAVMEHNYGLQWINGKWSQ